MPRLSEMVNSGFQSGNAIIETKFFDITDISQTTFKLKSTINSSDHIFVFLNGKHINLTNFTTNNNNLILINVPLSVGDVLHVVHFKSVTITGKSIDPFIEEFVGGQITYNLSSYANSNHGILVSINGNIQPPSNYQLIDGKILTFNTSTPINAKIVVMYLIGAVITTSSVLPNSVGLQHLALDSIDTRYARVENTYTKSDIDEKIDQLVNNAPDLLNSLSEIANALNNDPNFATNIQNQLNNKSPIGHDHNSIYYTKSELDVFLQSKADSINYYNNGQIDTILGEKANRHEVYSKSEIDSLLASNGNIVIPVIAGNRGIYSGGINNISFISNIEYFNITTFGNSVKFGNMINPLSATASASNGTNNIGLITGGFNNSSVNDIQKINILSASNSIEFGKLLSPRSSHCAVSNGTNNRTVIIGGTGGFTNDMEYITTNTPGNAKVFGNLLGTSKTNITGTSNGKNDRGVFGSLLYPNIWTNQFITIPTLSNSVVFGDSYGATHLSATSNDTQNRGIFAGGLMGGSNTVNTIHYINIAIQSNSVNFGTLTIARKSLAATSNGVNQRAIFAGGIESTNYYSSEVDFVNISINANAAPFGDLLLKQSDQSAMSNAAL